MLTDNIIGRCTQTTCLRQKSLQLLKTPVFPQLINCGNCENSIISTISTIHGICEWSEHWKNAALLLQHSTNACNQRKDSLLHIGTSKSLVLVPKSPKMNLLQCLIYSLIGISQWISLGKNVAFFLVGHMKEKGLVAPSKTTVQYFFNTFCRGAV